LRCRLIFHIFDLGKIILFGHDASLGFLGRGSRSTGLLALGRFLILTFTIFVLLFLLWHFGVVLVVLFTFHGFLLVLYFLRIILGSGSWCGLALFGWRSS
jgi:hypothetical protein